MSGFDCSAVSIDVTPFSAVPPRMRGRNSASGYTAVNDASIMSARATSDSIDG